MDKSFGCVLLYGAKRANVPHVVKRAMITMLFPSPALAREFAFEVLDDSAWEWKLNSWEKEFYGWKYAEQDCAIEVRIKAWSDLRNVLEGWHMVCLAEAGHGLDKERARQVRSLLDPFKDRLTALIDKED
jgi:hypothetical protein